MGFTVKELRALLELCREYGLAELEIEREGEKLRLRRQGPPAPLAAEAAPGPALAPARVAPGDQAATAEAAPAVRANLATIESPMVGTFYRAPSPEAPPYVREGDAVKRGQVVCVVEAMKLMNEIESKVAGRLVKVLVENAQPVEFGQPLFLVEP